MTQEYADLWLAYLKQKEEVMGIKETMELLNEFKELLQKLRAGLENKKLNFFEILGLAKQLMELVGQMQFDLIWEEIRDIDSEEGVEIANIILECKNIITAIVAIFQAPKEG